jgi:adenylylsulfate kinase
VSGWLLWLTGLPGAGKSTLAEALVARLRASGLQAVNLDGDRLRRGLCADLGYTEQDRRENLRRAGEVATLLAQAGCGVVASFVSPYREDRVRIRARFAPGRFAEVYVRCPLAVCEARDPKGLYARARAGELPRFTGLSDPYEEPLAPELVLDTDRETPEACLGRLEALVRRLGDA